MENTFIPIMYKVHCGIAYYYRESYDIGQGTQTVGAVKQVFNGDNGDSGGGGGGQIPVVIFLLVGTYSSSSC